MTIANQIALSEFSKGPERYVEGQVLAANPVGYPQKYPLRRSIWGLNLTGDVSNGTYGATVTDVTTGVSYDIAVERAAGTPATAALVLTAWRAALLAASGINGILGGAVQVSEDLTLTARVAGHEFEVTDFVHPTDVAQVRTWTIDAAAEGTYSIEINDTDTASFDAVEAVAQVRTWTIDDTATGDFEIEIDGTDTASISVPAAVAQIRHWTIEDTAAGAYEIEINGTDTATITVVAETVEQIRDNLLADLQGFALDITFAAVSTDGISGTADVAGVPFTSVETAPSDNISMVETEPNVTPETVEEIRDALLSDLQGFALDITFAAVSTDQITGTADVAGTAFTSVETAPSNFITMEETVENVVASTIEEIRDALLSDLQGFGLDITFADVDTDVITGTADDDGVAFTSVESAPGDNITMEETTAIIVFSGSETQPPNGGRLPVGRVVVRAVIDGAQGIRLPNSTDALASFAGAIVRPHTMPPRQAKPLIGHVTEFVEGLTQTPMEEALVAMRNNGSVAATFGSNAYVVVSTAGGNELGQLRADDDGANAVLPTSPVYTWQEPTAPGELGAVRIHR